MEIERAHKVTLTESVTKQLISLILSGAFAPGEKLPSQKELANKFGVGRTCIREAMQGLALMKLIEIRAGSGAFVATSQISRNLDADALLGSIEKAALHELFEARAMMEIDMAGLAAERADEEEIEKIEGILRDMQASKSDVDKSFKLNRVFHLAIANAAKNTILEKVLDSTLNLMSHSRREITANPVFSELDINSHQRIFEAIRDRDAQRAKRAMQRHFDAIVKYSARRER